MLNLNWDNRTTIDKLGVIATVLVTLTMFFFALNISIFAVIVLAIFFYAKRERVKRTIEKDGFGTGICIYAVWIICMLLYTSSALTIEQLIVGSLMTIAGLFIIPLFSKKARIAAPFILFLFTIGLLFFKLENSSSDNSSDSSIDVAPASDNTSSFIDASSTDLNTNISTDNSAFNSVNTNVNTSILPITNNINETVANNNVDFNTPTQDNPTTINVTSADFTNQTTINTDTGVITGSEGQTIGSVSQDNNTVIKDNMGNTILSKDETNGFVYDEEGKPQGIVDNNGDIKTYYDVNTGETKIVDNGTIYDNEGKIEGHIQKK